MNYFVTGLHRAGTHRAAKDMAVKFKQIYLEEAVIRWDSIDDVKDLIKGKIPSEKNIMFKKEKNVERSLKRGFVLQCPGLAHKVEELAQYGKVYWCTRNHKDIVTSMVNLHIDDMAWHIVAGFREQFPDDPIWNKLTYDGSEDFPLGFPIYHTLTVKVKEYFYNTQFKDICEKIVLEGQGYYDYDKTVTKMKPLKMKAHKLFRNAESIYESICIH